MLTIIPIAFATFMAFIDVISLGAIKHYTLGVTHWAMIPVAMILYGLQPLVFLKSLQYETMTVMNIMWDIISDILVTATGLLYFKEKLTTMKQVGISFAFIAIVLLSYDEFSER